MSASRAAFALGFVCAVSAFAQAPALPPEAPAPAIGDQRVLGVLPNHRTTEASHPFRKISFKEKMTIAFKDSTDTPVYPTAAMFAAVYQLENQNPSFGQGMAGYGKRFATAYADQVAGNMFAEGLIPSLTREDPRYFRLGEGSSKYRAWYAVTRIFVCRTDHNHNTFNIAEWGGNSAAVALSNAYYPDTRTARDNAQKLLIQCGVDALSNMMKEFWPDISRKLHKKR